VRQQRGRRYARGLLTDTPHIVTAAARAAVGMWQADDHSHRDLRLAGDRQDDPCGSFGRAWNEGLRTYVLLLVHRAWDATEVLGRRERSPSRSGRNQTGAGAPNRSQRTPARARQLVTTRDTSGLVGHPGRLADRHIRQVLVHQWSCKSPITGSIPVPASREEAPLTCDDVVRGGSRPGATRGRLPTIRQPQVSRPSATSRPRCALPPVAARRRGGCPCRRSR
jgi:hypothetical protein